MRATILPFVIALVVWLSPGQGSWAAGLPKRVLVLDSYGRNVATTSTVISVFRTELSSRSPEPIDLHEVSLEMARFVQPEQEVPFVNFLKERFSGRHPDLVVPVGGPAFTFLARHREGLFPAAPVLIAGVAEQVLRTGRVPGNATVLPIPIDLRGMIADILQTLPGTTDIAVILGRSPLETFWLNECRREFAAFSGRVNFTYLNHLPFEEIRHRVAALPPNSAIFFALLIVDAAGIPFDPAEALRGIIASANSPVFALHESFFGLGTVGGRLIPERAAGLQAAAAALRILQGESPANVPSLSPEAALPVYDWRALQRWGISESRLPQGSQVHFRQPSLWELYRWHVTAGAGLLMFQAVLIAGLLIQRRRRKRAERELAKSEQESRRLQDELLHAGRISTMGELAGALAHEINQPLSAIMSNAQAARRYLDSSAPDTEEVKEILNDIVKDDARAGEVINRLRALLKKTDAAFEPLDLNLIFREVIGFLNSDVVIRDVEVFTELEPLLPSVRGDRIQLQQVAFNLLLNAFEAMTECPRAERQVLIRTSQRDSEVLAAVTDNGKGISPGETGKVFQPFYSTKPHGLGMGLAISRSIINRHQGRIWVENNPDGGATFYFSLPVPTHERKSNRA